MSTTISSNPLRSAARPRRSLVAIALIASVAAGTAACGDEVDEVPSADVPTAAQAVQWGPYLSYQAGLAESLQARRQAAAASSDRHLELLNDEIAARVTVTRPRAVAGDSRVKAV